MKNNVCDYEFAEHNEFSVARSVGETREVRERSEGETETERTVE